MNEYSFKNLIKDNGEVLSEEGIHFKNTEDYLGDLFHFCGIPPRYDIEREWYNEK
jgi:hypothetical protein